MKKSFFVAAAILLLLASCATGERTENTRPAAAADTAISKPVERPAVQPPEQPAEPAEVLPEPAISEITVQKPVQPENVSVPEQVYRLPQAAAPVEDPDTGILQNLLSYRSSDTAKDIAIRVFPQETKLFVSDGVKLVALEENLREKDISYYSSDAGAAVFRAPGFDTRIVPLPENGETLEIKLERTGGPLTRVGEISTGHQPKSVRFTPDGKSLIVTNLGDFTAAGQFTLEPLSNLRNLQVPEEYRSDSGFVETLILPIRNEIWLTQMTVHTIHIFDLDSGGFKESIQLTGKWPKVLIASADESRVYASCWDSNEVIEIDPSTRTEIRSFSTSGTPRGMAFSPDGKELLTAIFSSSGIDRISLETGKRMDTFDAAPGRIQAMRHIVYNPVLKEYYVTAMGAERVYRMSEDGSWLNWWPVGDKPNTCVVSPDGTRLFVSCRGPNNPDIGYLYKGYEFGKIYIINLLSGEIEDWIWGRDQPTGLDISPDGRFIAFSDFLSNKLEIYRIN